MVICTASPVAWIVMCRSWCEIGSTNYLLPDSGLAFGGFTLCCCMAGSCHGCKMSASRLMQLPGNEGLATSSSCYSSITSGWRHVFAIAGVQSADSRQCETQNKKAAWHKCYQPTIGKINSQVGLSHSALHDGLMNLVRCQIMHLID